MSLPSRSPRRAPVRRALLGAVAAVLAGLGTTGCEVSSFIDPSQLVDPERENQLSPDGRAQARIVPILTDLDLGVTREPESFADARDVRAEDLEIRVEDYRIGPGDLLRVQVPDLLGRGQLPSVTPVSVSETGNISLPDIGEVFVEGMTAREAEANINERFREEGILVNPQANVVVVEAFNRTFSVLGAVAQPGRYAIARSDFRFLDAFVLARGSPEVQTAPEYAYVIRVSGRRQQPQQPQQPPAQPPRGAPLRPGVDDPLNPRTEADADHPLFAVSQPGQAFEFSPPEQPGDREVIRIPLQELLRGQLRFDIIIRPDDLIIVPIPQTGEYYMGGEVAVTGAYAILPGRQITLKQAIVSSRMLNQVAIPQRTQLIRRVNDQDVFVRVNLAKIFIGQEPDLYLKPNDIVLVGTNLPAPFLAAIRNGFRVTYGFGFLYDRNFGRNDGRFLF